MRFFKLHNGSYTALKNVSWTIQTDKDNSLRVEAIGNKFDMYVNNRFVFNLIDNSYSYAIYKSNKRVK